MRLKSFLLIMVSLFQVASSQDSSPLHQYMATHSLVTRPEAFRDLQDNLKDALGTPVKGAQLEVLYSVLSSVRLKISAALQFRASEEGNKLIVEYRQDTTWQKVIIEFPAANQLSLFDKVETELGMRLNTLFNSALSGLNPNLQKAIITSAVDALRSTPYASRISTSETGTTGDLSTLIARIVRNELEKQANMLVPEIRTIAVASSDRQKSILESFRKVVVEALNTLSVQVNELVATAFDQTESRVRESILEFSRLLVSANSGLAVTEGKGQFAGGLQLTWWMNKTLQFGVYFSRQQSNADSTLKGKSLVGFRGLAASGDLELTLMAAVSRRESDLEQSSTEVGIGAGYRLSSEVILRGEFYVLQDGMGKTFNIGGLSVQATQAGSPSLFVGYATGSKNLIYQISFPILAQEVTN